MLTDYAFKPLTVKPIIAEQVYAHLNQNGLLEQKGCRKGSGGTKDRFLIEKDGNGELQTKAHQSECDMD